MRMDRVTPRNVVDEGEAGFTLVELLVGIVLLSLLTMAMFSSLRFGALAWTLGTNHADRLQRVLLVQGLLTRLIEASYPYYVISDPTHPRVSFDGARNELSFLAPAPIARGESARMSYLLFAKKRGPLSSLVLASRPELSKARAAESQVTLFDEAEAIEFGYFGKAHGDRNADWHERWNDEAASPTLVRIRIKPTRSDWLEIVIATRIAVDVSCDYDPLTRACKAR